MWNAKRQLSSSIIAVTGALLVGISTGYTDQPLLPRAKGEQCVEPTDLMRRDHMKFLIHQRDKTVHLGIRTKRHSLNGCVDCHVQTNNEGQFIPIDAPKQFCAVCHTYASVKLDCFECHATTPDQTYSALQFSPDIVAKLHQYLSLSGAQRNSMTSAVP